MQFLVLGMLEEWVTVKINCSKKIHQLYRCKPCQVELLKFVPPLVSGKVNQCKNMTTLHLKKTVFVSVVNLTATVNFQTIASKMFVWFKCESFI